MTTSDDPSLKEGRGFPDTAGNPAVPERRPAVSAEKRHALQFELATFLQAIPRVREIQSEIVQLLEEELDYTIHLDQALSTGSFALQLVMRCARFSGGLRVLARVVNGVAAGSLEAEGVDRLVDEWEALAAVPELEPLWAMLEKALSDIDPVDLASLYQRACGPRPMDLPKHCSTLWTTFVRLVGRNAGPDGSLPWVRLIALLSDQMELGAAERIDATLTEVFRGWGTPALLNEAQAKTRSPSLALRRAGVVIIRVVRDSVDREWFTVSHVVRWGGRHVPAAKGEEHVVSRADLQGDVEALMKQVEAEWGTRSDTIDIEFLLPLELLNEPVEWWPKDSATAPDQPPLAQYYGVVVRSVDRFSNASLHRVWLNRWEQLLNHPGDCHVKWADASRADHLRRLEAEIMNDPQCVGLVLSRPPIPDAGVSQEMVIALRTGLPLVLWHRTDCSRADFLRMTRAIVDPPLASLPLRASQLRRSLGELETTERDDDAVLGLAVLWDDAHRLPHVGAAAAG
jgi:hypothetical protein